MFDFNELLDLERDMKNIAKALPKESKTFLARQGTNLKNKTLNRASGLVNEKTGNYFKGIKRGKVYFYGSDKVLSVRVYSNAPHAHLIEDGHKKTGGGYVDGKSVFDKSQKEFQGEYHQNCKKFVDRMMKKL